MCLNEVELKNRYNVELGISTGKFGRHWYSLPQGRAIFKTYDGSFMLYLKNIRIINEVVCFHLANQAGIACAKYEPANLQIGKEDNVGLVSFDITKPREKLIHLYELTYEGCKDYWTLYQIYNNIEQLNYKYSLDRDKICLHLYEMMIFDLLTMQTDRNTHNIHFILNKDTKEFTSSPLIDNEFAFCAKRIKRILNTRKPSTKDALIFEMNNLSNDDLSKKEIYLYRVNNEEDRLDSYFETIKEVVRLANEYEEARESLSRILSNINIEDAINKTEAMGYKIDENYKEYLRLVMSVSMEAFEEIIFQNNNENDLIF